MFNNCVFLDHGGCDEMYIFTRILDQHIIIIISCILFTWQGKLKAPAPDMFAFGLNQVVSMAILELWASEIVR